MQRFQEKPAVCFLPRSRAFVTACSFVWLLGPYCKGWRRHIKWIHVRNGLSLKRLLVLTEVFFPFKDDIAVLTKFKLLQSEGIVLASVPPSFLLSVPSVAFFCF